MSAELTNKLARLRDRADCLGRVRNFFSERGVLEVDTPVLSASAPMDPYIDLVTATCMGRPAYLHSSPEYAMKRLLALGIGDCYQLSHVFREGELGERHNPEFTMIEWYRVPGEFEDIIEETVALSQLLLGPQTVCVIGYEELFHSRLGFFPDTIEERDRLFADELEPTLEMLTVLRDYPPEQAMLAKIVEKGGYRVAHRFELFYRGMELANGYQELTNLKELRERLTSNQALRIGLGKEGYQLDEPFLDTEIPESCGVALGFDRLMMLRHSVEDISEVLSFGWEDLNRKK